MQPRHSSSETLSYPMPATAEQGAALHERVQVEPDAASVHETTPLTPEQQPGVSDGRSDAALQATAIPALPTPQPSMAATQVQDPQDENPIIAADDDLIEKEWVDKAKKIILDTRDDPFRREQEIAKLQIDYIKKRYGRVIGESSSG